VPIDGAKVHRRIRNSGVVIVRDDEFATHSALLCAAISPTRPDDVGITVKVPNEWVVVVTEENLVATSRYFVGQPLVVFHRKSIGIQFVSLFPLGIGYIWRVQVDENIFSWLLQQRPVIS
jgi:hypothetical protein